MPIKRRRPFEPGRYVLSIAKQRIKKLVAIKQQLLELDNRLKMEMFGLRELVEDKTDVCRIIDLENEAFTSPAIASVCACNIFLHNFTRSRFLYSSCLSDSNGHLSQYLLFILKTVKYLAIHLSVH